MKQLHSSKGSKRPLQEEQPVADGPSNTPLFFKSISEDLMTDLLAEEVPALLQNKLSKALGVDDYDTGLRGAARVDLLTTTLWWARDVAELSTKQASATYELVSILVDMIADAQPLAKLLGYARLVVEVFCEVQEESVSQRTISLFTFAPGPGCPHPLHEAIPEELLTALKGCKPDSLAPSQVPSANGSRTQNSSRATLEIEPGASCATLSVGDKTTANELAELAKKLLEQYSIEQLAYLVSETADPILKQFGAEVQTKLASKLNTVLAALSRHDSTR